MRVKIKDCGKGVNKDLLPSELLPGQWSDSLNMRARNGFAQKRKGVKAAYTTPAVVPYWIHTYVTATARFVLEAGIAKVYADDGTTQTEITRYTDGVEISSSTNSTTTATVNTATAHGRTTGQTITRYGAFPAAYNGTFVITVSDADTFTYTMLSDPGGSATIQGNYSYNVQSDFTGAIDDKWTGGVFNGVGVLNNPVDGPYYWNGDVTTRLRRFPGWPAGQKCDALVIFKNYLIALAPTINGVKQRQLVLWCKAAEPGSMPTEWTATATNDAGDTPQAAARGGSLVDGRPLGDTLAIYGQDGRFALSYIGGNSVFRMSSLPGSDGLLARGCIAETPKGHVFLSNGDVKIHNGGEAVSICEGRIRKWLFNTMDSTNAQRSFLAVNAQTKEVWVVFPSYGQATCDTVAAWNWEDDTWGIFSVSSVTHGTSGLIATGLNADTWASDTDSWDSDGSTWKENEYSQNEARLILATSTPRIGLAETGTTDFGTSVSWLLEKVGISLEDSDSVKVFSASRPQIDALAGTQFSVAHGSAKTADGAPTYSAPVTFTVGTTDWANRFANGGKYLAIKMYGSNDQPIAMKTYDIDFTVQGR